MPLDLILLRRIAEEQLHGERGVPPTGTLEFELGVHDIELKMQNEALRDAIVELERARDRYRQLYDLAPIPYLTLSFAGAVVRANAAAARMLGMPVARLRGVAIASFLSPEHAEAFELHRREVVSVGSAAIALTMLSRGDKQHDVRLESVCPDPRSQEWHTTLVARGPIPNRGPVPAQAASRRAARGGAQLLKLDGSGVPVSRFDLHWTESKGWSFTAVAETAVTTKITAVEILGTVRPVAVDKKHVAGEKSSFAGTLPNPDSP